MPLRWSRKHHPLKCQISIHRSRLHRYHPPPPPHHLHLYHRSRRHLCYLLSRPQMTPTIRLQIYKVPLNATILKVVPQTFPKKICSTDTLFLGEFAASDLCWDAGFLIVLFLVGIVSFMFYLCALSHCFTFL